MILEWADCQLTQTTFFQLAKFLLEQGAYIDDNDRRGEMSRLTPLLAACQVGNLDMCEFLVDQGANVNAVANRGKEEEYKFIYIFHAICQQKNHRLFRKFAEKIMDKR